MRFIRNMRFTRNSLIGDPCISYTRWVAGVAAVVTVVTAAMVPSAGFTPMDDAV